MDSESMSTRFKNRVLWAVMDGKDMKYINGIVKEEYAKYKKIAPSAEEAVALVVKEYNVFARLACIQTGVPFKKSFLCSLGGGAKSKDIG